MESGNDNIDFTKFLNNKSNDDNITPHKIAVVAFIREYGLLKREAKLMVDRTMAPKYRKDFCILALKLIQCPDMEFKELEALLTDGRYNLSSVHLQNFCVRLQNIYINGINALMDCVISSVEKLMLDHSETAPCVITRSSILGFYLRRIMIHLDRLTFVQIVSLYKSFCVYYQRGRPGLMMRSLSKEKLNNMDSPALPEEMKPQDIIKVNAYDRDNTLEECKWSRKQAELFTAQQANLLQVNENKALQPRQLQKTIMQIIHDIPEYPDVHFLSFLNCIRMKEFCGAQDSLYNCFDRTVFSNCGSNSSSNDKNKNFRYAALNRAAMHTKFGHKAVGMESVREAVAAAQEVADGACLAAAGAWGALAGGRARLAALLARAPRPPRAAAAAAQLMAQHAAVNAAKPSHVFQVHFTQAQEAANGACLAAAGAWGALAGGRARLAALLARAPRPPRAAAAAAQLMAQHAAVNAAKPSHVFQIITKGASINYLHSLTDLTMVGLANTAALWALYGKTEMASVSSQLLLNLNTKCRVGTGRVWHLSECGGAGGAAGAGALAAAAWRGHGALAAALASRCTEPGARARAAGHFAASALLAGKWEEADQSIKQLASFDRWQSQLLKAEMYFLKGDATDALESLQDVLDYCRTEDDSLHYVALRVKAMIIMSEVQQSFSSSQYTNIMLLNEALSIAIKYHLHYLAATAEMHIANVQLHMGCTKNALLLVRKVLPSVMAHGSAYDLARGLLLYTKCRISSAPTTGEPRIQVLQSCCEALESVKENFSKVGAQFRLLQTWYLQAQLYHDMGNFAARNQCAWMYRQLETQNPIEPSYMLHVMY